jgi:hypothetical protein
MEVSRMAGCHVIMQPTTLAGLASLLKSRGPDRVFLSKLSESRKPGSGANGHRCNAQLQVICRIARSAILLFLAYDLDLITWSWVLYYYYEMSFRVTMLSGFRGGYVYNLAGTA